MPPNYERWAKDVREKMEKDVADQREHHLKDLNKATVFAFNSIREDMKQGFQSLEYKVEAKLEKKWRKTSKNILSENSIRPNKQEQLHLFKEFKTEDCYKVLSGIHLCFPFSLQHSHALSML